jgi:hypothetical protein
VALYCFADKCLAASPDVLALHSTITACISSAKNWEPFAFRLLRACAVINRPAEVAAAEKHLNQMRLYAQTRAHVATASCMNAVAHAAPVECTVQAHVSASSASSVTWVCACCCYAAQYALVCAFFLEQGPNPLFIDVITGSSCSCMPIGRLSSMGNNVIACACSHEFVVATDAASLFLYR